MGTFSSQWIKGLAKTRQIFSQKMASLFRRDQISENTWEGLEALLLEADVGPEMTHTILSSLKESLKKEEPDSETALRALFKTKLKELLIAQDSKKSFLVETPWVIVVVGVNGTGKTTSIGKLAYWLKNQGKKVVLVAGDTFRAGAFEQLQVWANRVGVPCMGQKPGADPASVAYDAVDHAIAHHLDVVLIDTAGRLHTKVNLMQELQKICRVISKRLPSAPHDIWLVLDATVGQNGLQQAKVFSDAVPLTGVILTKLDGTARGGIVFAISQQLGIPVRWVGVGEGIEDFLPFDPDIFVESLIGEESVFS